MAILIMGLVLFLGSHLLPRFQGLRASLMTRLGAAPYRLVYTGVSVLGIVLIAYGYSQYRAGGYIPVWTPPKGMSHLSVLLLWLSMVLLAASGPAGRIKLMAKHPMLAAVKIWALAHLLANGDLGSIVLFGSFLAWAVYARIALKRAGDMGATTLSTNPARADIIALVAGTAFTLVMVFGLHKWLIGVAVFS